MVKYLKQVNPAEEEMIISSELKHLPHIEDLSRHITERMGFDEDQEANLAIALTEVVNNAITHGNQNDPQKKVTIRITYEKQAVIISITDEGKGFDPTQLPNPTNAQNIWREHGRGIFLIRNLIDEVDIQPSPNGTKVILREHLHKNKTDKI